MAIKTDELDDSEKLIPVMSPVCTFCRHLVSIGRCKAFRSRDIPLPIWTGKNNHKKPYPGDNGIQFSPVED